jgi:hypothetical protein
MEEGLMILDFVIMLPEYHYSLENGLLILKRRQYLYDNSNPDGYFLDIEMYYSQKTERDEN